MKKIDWAEHLVTVIARKNRRRQRTPRLWYKAGWMTGSKNYKCTHPENSDFMRGYRKGKARREKVNRRTTEGR